jgi:hypothetical protein
MKKIVIGLTTTPQRQEELNRSIASFRKGWIKDKIYIFGEPWKYKIKDKNVKLKINKVQLWCMGNFHNMLSSLLEIDADFVWLWQDDFVYWKDIWKKLKEILDFEWKAGYFAMTTRPRMEKHIYKNWRNDTRLGRYAWGMNYIMQTDVAKNMIRHPFYQNHLRTYWLNQQVDSCISFVLQSMKQPMYYHNPSLSFHSGDSTIWHTDRYYGEIFHKEFQPTKIWIASIPNREQELKKTIESLYFQADEIVVGLNWYDHTPEFLKKPGITVVHWDNSLWDAMKFIHIDWYKGYYFSCDDDLYFPKDYVKNMILWIEKYERKAIVWLHWVVVPPNKLASYYNNCYRYTYSQFLPTDNCVNVLGTWVMAFHTDTIKLSIKDFPEPNMWDTWVWIKAQKQKIPMICLKHKAGLIQTMNTNWSIREEKHNDDSDITEVVNSIKRGVTYIPQKLD